MAGGLFKNYPFELNIKCVIFSTIIIALFFFQPPEMSLVWKCFIAVLLFVVAYVAMAWYDYKFECTKLALKRGSKGGLTTLFKPPPHVESQTDTSKETTDEKQLTMALINIYHIFIITPLLLYVGINGIKKKNINQTATVILIANFAFGILYHIVRVLRKFNGVSFGHVLGGTIGIILLLMKQKPVAFYYALVFIAFYALIKHGYHLMVSSHALHTDVDIKLKNEN
jgi:hypothetical protein